MCLSAALLRILLCLSLVLNGSGYAFASAHLPGAMHGDAAVAAVATQANCHDADIATGVALPSPSGEHLGAVIPTSDLFDPDCCAAANCRCACVHGAGASVPMTAGHPLVPVPQAVMHVQASAHPTPALPHLIRPPIG